jgi:hypothetical protein
MTKVVSHVDLAEKVFITSLVVGLILTYLNLDNKLIIKVSLVALAITYFLTSFKIIEIPKKEDEQFEFKEMLSWIIVPKVLWISCAVSLFGLFVYTLQLGHDGYKRAFMVGGMTIITGLLFLGYALITGTKYLKYILPTVLRAILLLTVDFYLLYK